MGYIREGNKYLDAWDKQDAKLKILENLPQRELNN
jgi:hypothetical protein